MRMFLTLVILLVAQPFAARGEEAKAPEPKVIARKSESHKFSGLNLKGQLKKPELSYIYKRKGVRSEKIVNIPENFNDQIVQDSSKF